MTRRLICMISTEGKSSEQIVAETWAAYQEWLKANPQEPFKPVLRLKPEPD